MFKILRRRLGQNELINQLTEKSQKDSSVNLLYMAEEVVVVFLLLFAIFADYIIIVGNTVTLLEQERVKMETRRLSYIIYEKGENRRVFP